MNQVADLQQQTLNCKTPIKVLSIASLLLTLLSSISYFVVYYSSWGNGGEIDSVTFVFPVQIGEIISLIVSVILPALIMGLFIIYIFAFHKKQRAKAMPFVIFIALAVLPIIEYACGLLFGLWFSSFRFMGGPIIAILLQCAIRVIPFVLAAISALKGFSKKALLVIGVISVLALELLDFIPLFGDNFWYLDNEMYLYLLCWISEFLGLITFYIALLLFGLKNRIPAVISSKTKNINKLNPTQALRALKNDFELGIITEQEYQARRAEILSKL